MLGKQLVVLEKNETWWQSIVSDLFTYSLAFLLLLASWLLDQALWSVVAILLFVASMSAAACETKAVKIRNKAEAIKWAHSLEAD